LLLQQSQSNLVKLINKTLIILILLSVTVFAQSETHRWSGKKADCKIPEISERNYSIDDSSVMMTVVSGFQYAYYFLVSDYDGDNCPFTPTCSNFFVQSVKRTNLLQGALMFADRFTRDLNFIEREKYPRSETGRLIDLPRNYELNESGIVIIPKQSDKEKK